MKCPVTTLDNKQAGEIELDDTVFGLPARKDILARVVNWQLAKRRAGTHKVKTRGEVRSEEHTSELQSLMRNSYAVFCLKNKNNEQDNCHTPTSYQQNEQTTQ